MRYLITHPDRPPFFTQWFDPENHFSEGMIVYDFASVTFTTNGITWVEIEIDHL